MGIAGDAPAWAERAGIIDDRVKGWTDLRVVQQTSHGSSDDVVDALVGREREGSHEPVLALRESQGQGLQRLFWQVLHQSTMTQKKRSMSIRECRGLCALAMAASLPPAAGGAMTGGLAKGRGRAVRVQVRLPAELHRALEACAERSGLSTVGLVRLLLEEALGTSPSTASEALKSRRGTADLVSLCALVASEHAIKLYELIIPDGSRRSRDVRGLALEAAERRIEEVRTQIEDGQ